MFEITRAEAHWWPVSYTLPRADDGQPAPGPVAQFEVEFRILNERGMVEIGEAIEAKSITDAQLVERVCTGRVRGLTDRGQEMPDTPETWARVRGLRGMDYHLCTAFFSAQHQGAEGN